jgi:hypothetical protein
VSARERVEAAIQAAGLEVVGLDRLDQMIALVDAGFTAMADEFDALFAEMTAAPEPATVVHVREARDVDALGALRDVVRLLDGPQPERAQEAQDVAKAALRRLDGGGNDA